jgi:hypothetical protein
MISRQKTPSKAQTLIKGVCTSLSHFKQVLAIAVGGSTSQNHNQPDSDIDLYVYLRNGTHIPPEARLELTRARGAIHAEINNEFWETGDEWQEPNGVYLDVIYREQVWIENQLDAVLVKHQSSLGYTTCIWHNVLHSSIVYDPTGWFLKLQKSVAIPYPNALRQAIIAKNYPILRQTISSYKHQILKALHRKDYVSLNHRVSAFLASYFDILFALNNLTHPGEKRLLMLCVATCSLLPKNLDSIPKLIQLSAKADSRVARILDDLIDELDRMLAQVDL